MTPTKTKMLSPALIVKAKQRLSEIIDPTPLMYNHNLSHKFDCHVWLKREDLQVVRSYKIRGAYNRMSHLTEAEREKGVICSSAGNHAQGVALSCFKLGIRGKIFMPITTPRQKVDKVKMFGKEQVEVFLIGDTYDDAYEAAQEEMEKSGSVFIHPFDDEAIIAGQGTVGMEILRDAKQTIDYIFMGIGGGGLAAGVGSYIKQLSPETKIIGVEPAGAPAMKLSLEKKKIITLAEIDKFVDGAAVRKVGQIPFNICQEVVEDVILVPEGKVCSTILQLYNEEAIVVEPAGALSISCLDFYKEEIKGKHIVCVVSGSNNDITRTEEIKERSLLYEGLKHYFLVNFPQRAGALREFLENVLGPNDDITRFEYIKKNNRENAPALIGIELASRKDYKSLIERMDTFTVQYQVVNDDPTLFNLFV
ncbi:MAG: threonine ammonia-lyase [Bacteroidota bacterium]